MKQEIHILQDDDKIIYNATGDMHQQIGILVQLMVRNLLEISRDEEVFNANLQILINNALAFETQKQMSASFETREELEKFVKDNYGDL